MILLCFVSLALAQSQPPNPRADRRLIWNDEFNKPGLPDAKKWDYEVGKIRNNELQYYTKARRENARIENGHLTIEARKEPFEGIDVTSASLNSKRAFQYVYVEVRAKIPTGRGTWPAIWMLGDSVRKKGSEYVDWPKCGEIDIMENVGFDPTKMVFTIHTEDTEQGKVKVHGTSIDVPKVWTRFHTYGLDWRRDRLDLYFDGKKTLTYPNDRRGVGTWPFDSPAYIILNLAIGGDWGGKRGIAPDLFPAKFLVDYVRVYQ